MPLSLDDLMPSQLRLLAKLCGSDEPADAIGCEISELTDDEMLTGGTLVTIGFVEVYEGWRGTHWLVLTGYAQRLIEEGLAS